MAKCLLRRTGVNLLSLNPSKSGQCSSRAPLTGEPDAGNPPVRFGGRGRAKPPVPTPIYRRSLRDKMANRRAITEYLRLEEPPAQRFKLFQQNLSCPVLGGQVRLSFH